MHDAYRALVSPGTATTKSIAANQLLKNVPIFNARIFKKVYTDAKIDLETSRLEEVLFDAFFLARDVLSGRARQNQIETRHTTNADWLTDTIARSACFTESAGQAQSAPSSKPSVQEPSDHTVKELAKKYTPDARNLLPFLILVLAGLAGYLIYHSRHFRIKRVSRLPRISVAFKAQAVFNGTQCNIIVLDISLGGSKIECDRPLNEKERVTLYLTCGTVEATIVWATAFYAGVMFDKQLTDDQLQTVINDEAVTTRSRLSNVF